MLFNFALVTSGTRIIIDNFQCHDALWLFDMSVYLLETGRASNWTEIIEGYPCRSRASHTVEDTPQPTLTKVW
jgi:hypothetical protein